RARAPSACRSRSGRDGRFREGPRPSRAGARGPRSLRLHRRRPAQTEDRRSLALGVAPRRACRVMALPFPSNGDPAMPHPNNAPRFDDLEGLALGDIAALPPEMLLDLQTTAL